MINLQQVTDARLASLQQQLAARAAQVAQLQQQVAAAHQQVAARDAEVSRLSGLLGTGPDVERLARDQLAAASDNIILSLNKQVCELRIQHAWGCWWQGGSGTSNRQGHAGEKACACFACHYT